MPWAGYIVRSVYAAWRLARLDPGGMAFFDQTITGFFKSFLAALVIAPFYAYLSALRYDAELAGLGALAYTVREGAAYGLGWILYPVVMIGVARLLKLEARYVPFIIAYNWASVVMMALLFPVNAVVLGGLAPEAVAGVLVVAAAALALFYQWFVTRVALETTGATAAAIVALEVVLSLLVGAALMSIA